MFRVAAASVLFAMPVLAQPTAKSAPPKVAVIPEGGERLLNVAYVPNGHERQKLDLYLPKQPRKKIPLVVWIHGGGWEGGSKEGTPALGLLWHGYAVASINYRLSTHAPFPAQLDDCKAAIRYLRRHAEEHGIDPERIAVWGASAGGHLSALVGVTGNRDDNVKGPNANISSRVKAVCDFCGPTDLMLYGGSRPGDTLSRLIGGPIQQNQEKVALANPIRYVDAQSPPFLIVHGDKDNVVPLVHSQRLNEALEKAGVPTTLRVIAGAGHALNGGKEVQDAVLKFFNETLRPAS